MVTDIQELKSIVDEVLSNSNGIFLKIFTKDSTGKYYIMMLTDRSKLLAIEAMLVDQKTSVMGDEAFGIFKSLLGKPMVLDIYQLDEISLKLSVADNIDAYTSTPQVAISELFGMTSETKEEKESLPQPKEEVRTERKTPIKKAEIKHEIKKESKPLVQESIKQIEAPEVEISLRGGSIPEGAFKKYAEDLLKESKRIKGLKITKIVFEGNVGEGVVYLNVALYGFSNAPPMQKEIAEKRMMHAISKYAPVIFRETGIKAIIKGMKIVIDGEEVRPQEIVERDKRKTASVGKDGVITLTALEDYWTYFSAFSKTILKEIEDAGIKVKKMYVDVVGRQEFEINISLAGTSSSNMDKIKAETTVGAIVSRHEGERGRLLKKSTTVHRVTV
ncbi:hypothetical protein, partial [Thermococcus sp.]